MSSSWKQLVSKDIFLLLTLFLFHLQTCDCVTPLILGHLTDDLDSDSSMAAKHIAHSTSHLETTVGFTGRFRFRTVSRKQQEN